MVSSSGTISFGALAISASILVIFSSGLLPWMFPSRTIFRAMALVASPHALSLSARWMIGSNFSIAVFGRPLLMASSTSFHSGSREAAKEYEQFMTIVTRTTERTLLIIRILSDWPIRRNQR